MNARRKFREQRNIDENTTVLFYAPGNTVEEVSFTFEQVREGIKEFLLKYSAPTSLSPIAKPLKYFHTIISLSEGTESEKHFKNLMSQSVDPWFGSFEYVSNN